MSTIVTRQVSRHDSKGYTIIVRVADVRVNHEIVISVWIANKTAGFEPLHSFDYVHGKHKQAMEDALHFVNEFISEFLNES